MDKIEFNQKKRHLTNNERANIELLHKEKVKPSEIARRLNRHRSVITRELKRNSVDQMDSELRVSKKYFADTATLLYKKRRKNTGSKLKLAEVNELIEYAEHKILKEKWSPDAAIGRFKIEYPHKNSISAKTFYNYIDLGLLKTKPIDLHLKTRLKLKKRRIVKRKRELGKSIELRPIEANNRSEIGHWEMDTVVGNRSTSNVLLTLTERVTGYEIITRINDKSSESTILGLNKIKARFKNNFNILFKSITCDNGSEFSKCFDMELLLGIPIYYAHPYSSFERGTNENYNAIIRRFIPKGKSIDNIKCSSISKIEAFMNNLPRKRFNYLSPIEYMATLI
jgi:IS30 family transposase